MTKGLLIMDVIIYLLVLVNELILMYALGIVECEFLVVIVVWFVVELVELIMMVVGVHWMASGAMFDVVVLYWHGYVLGWSA